MKQTAIWAAFFVILSVPALAQMSDTTSAWRYFPLEVGNVWEFRAEGGDFYEEGAVVLRLAGDTFVAGQHYFLLQTERYSDLSGPDPANPRVSLVRFDTASAFLMVRNDEGDERGWAPPNPYSPQVFLWPPLSALPCRLDISFGAETTCSDIEVFVSGGYEEETDFEVQTALKTFSPNWDITVSETHTYAADIGPLNFVAEEVGINRLRLQFARVGGVEYGESTGVDTEEAPPEANGALTVFPTPLHSATTVQFALNAPQHVTLTVYDVLGRRVLADDLGVQPAGDGTDRIDLTALPAGVYIVRLDGDAGARATTRIVRH